jgi:hypothetical protein
MRKRLGTLACTTTVIVAILSLGSKSDKEECLSRSRTTECSSRRITDEAGTVLPQLIHEDGTRKNGRFSTKETH